MGTLQRSIALARAAWAVLRQDKELAILPILSFAAWLVIAATFALPIAIDRGRDQRGRQLDLEPAGLGDRVRRLRRVDLRHDLLQRRDRVRRRRTVAGR